MTKRNWIALLTGILVLLTLGVWAEAREKKQAKVKMDRLSGTVQMIDKNTSTITLRTSSNVTRQVVYGPDTKFTKVNKPGGSVDEIKDGTRLICLGKFNDKTQLVAARIDIRLPR